VQPSPRRCPHAPPSPCPCPCPLALLVWVGACLSPPPASTQLAQQLGYTPPTTVELGADLLAEGTTAAAITGLIRLAASTSTCSLDQPGHILGTEQPPLPRKRVWSIDRGFDSDSIRWFEPSAVDGTVSGKGGSGGNPYSAGARKAQHSWGGNGKSASIQGHFANVGHRGLFFPPDDGQGSGGDDGQFRLRESYAPSATVLRSSGLELKHTDRDRVEKARERERRRCTPHRHSWRAGPVVVVCLRLLFPESPVTVTVASP